MSVELFSLICIVLCVVAALLISGLVDEIAAMFRSLRQAELEKQERRKQDPPDDE